MSSWFREYGDRSSGLVGFALTLLLLLSGIWQLTAIAAVIAGAMRRRPRRAFLVGFLSVAFAWGGFYAAYFLLTPAANLLALFSAILGLGSAAWPVVLLVMLGLSGLLGGLFAVVGSLAVRLVTPSPVAMPPGPP